MRRKIAIMLAGLALLAVPLAAQAVEPSWILAEPTAELDYGVETTISVHAMDIDDDALVITDLNTALPATAILTDNGDGTADIVWTPLIGEVSATPVNVVLNVFDGTTNVDTTIAVTIVNSDPTWDGGNATAGTTVHGVTAAVDLTVTITNTAPVWDSAPSAVAVDEDEALALTLAATDADVADSVLSYWILDNPVPDGMDVEVLTYSVGPRAGMDSLISISWTPTQDQAGEYNVTVKASDGAKDIFHVVTITANSVNDAPDWSDADVPDTLKVFRQDEFDETVGMATDADDDSLMYSATGLPLGATFNDTTLNFVWVVPDTAATDTSTMTLSVTDGTETVDIDIVVVIDSTESTSNREPEWRVESEINLDEGERLELVIVAEDGDESFGDSLIYAMISIPDSSSRWEVGYIDSSRTLIFDPGYYAADSLGSEVVKAVFSVHDADTTGGIDTLSIAISVNELNRAPAIAGAGDAVVTLGTTLSRTVTVSDPDTNDAAALTLTLIAKPMAATWDAGTGAFSLAVDAMVDTVAVFEISDGKETEQVEMAITSNHAPVWVPMLVDTAKSIEGEILKFEIEATDEDGDDLTYTYVKIYRTTYKNVASFDPETRVFTLNWKNPAAGYVVFSVSDGVASVPDTVHFRVVDLITKNPISDALPSVTELAGNFPNPFNPSTSVRYSMAEAGNVSIVIYNAVGQPVRTLVSGAAEAGRYNVLWDGMDNSQREVSTGLYLIRMVAGNYVSVRPMTLLR